jgi:hypothetical protein
MGPLTPVWCPKAQNAARAGAGPDRAMRARKHQAARIQRQAAHN